MQDIYQKKVKPADSLWSYATYLSLFPQLIAGPIVRYETIAKEMKERKETTNQVDRDMCHLLQKSVMLFAIKG